MKNQKSTRERILDAAEGIFGQRGYKTATIREICVKAGVNVASVNYYYNGKKGLYREVALRLFSEIFNRYPVSLENERDAGPKIRLHTFIKGVFSRLLSPGGLTGFLGRGQLVVRELTDPSPILNDIVDDFIRPTAAELGSIIRELLGPGAPERTVMKCQISVIGQCFHYAMARPILTRLLGETFTGGEVIEELCAHVTAFSLAGIADARMHMKNHEPPKTGSPAQKEIES